MNYFKNCCSRAGISCEFLFRACDRNGDQKIKFYEFKAFLNQIKIGLTYRTINKIIDIFNDSLQEYLTLNSYRQTLFTFNINDKDVIFIFRHIFLCGNLVRTRSMILSTIFKEKA